MGLSRLTRSALTAVHVLLVEVPGSWRQRVAVEQELAPRGWRPALAPADADLLVVCGAPETRLAEAVDRVWEQMPGPRARLDLATTEDLVAALDGAAARLADDDRQRADAAGRGGQSPRPPDHGGMDHGGMDHGGMDHGGMDMAPSGIPLAQGGRDRDGLEMDELHVPLGPVLPWWPPGLVLACTLHGDVVVDAEVELLGDAAPLRPPDPPEPPRVVRAAQSCDAARTLLAVAGWDDAAATAGRLRDDVLAGGDPEAVLPRLVQLRRRVARSWLLRWQLRALGRLGPGDLAEHGLPERLGGDVHSRLLLMLDEAVARLRAAGAPAAPDGTAEAQAVVSALPALVSGLDLAAARLVVASLPVDATAARTAAAT